MPTFNDPTVNTTPVVLEEFEINPATVSSVVLQSTERHYQVSNPITQGIRMLAPYGSGQIIPGDFLPQEIAKERGLTAQQQKLIDLGMFNRLFGR